MRFVLFIFLLFGGCAFKDPQFRYISVQECKLAPWSDRGVFEVQLPSYFIDDRFVYKEGHKLGYLQERLARDPQRFLSECAVRELGACLYPWECDARPKQLLHIEIEEFYYDLPKKEVVLIAFVNHRRYEVKEPVKEDVIEAAIKAYKKLLAQIGR